MVHKLDIIQVRDRYGQVRSETIDDEIYSDFKQDILDNIRKLPDIPLCPLDLIKAELESRGYKVGEISGREYQLKKLILIKVRFLKLKYVKKIIRQQRRKLVMNFSLAFLMQ